MANSPRWAFTAEWLDPASGVLWKHQFFFYPETNDVELMDIKNRRPFLKRIHTTEFGAEQVYVGATLTVCARQLRLTEYGDEYTRRTLEHRTERTLAIIKPDAVQHAGQIIGLASQAGLAIQNLRMCSLSRADAEDFYAVHRGTPFFDGLVAYMTSGPLVAMELVGPHAVRAWRDLLGPTDAHTARSAAPGTIRGRFGTDRMLNAAHGSDDPRNASRECGLFFSEARPLGLAPPPRGSADGSNSALLLIKPHAVKEGKTGEVLKAVTEAGFVLLGLQLFRLDKATAAEFLEVYKGVVPPGEWSGAVDELASGPCIAAEVGASSGGDGGGNGGSCSVATVEALRALAGPTDPDLARVLRPQSLRARFGASRVHNGVHTTDLPEDGPLETGYFFQLLAKGGSSMQ